ncbi:MAG: HU family DNA-binding protein [Bacteroidales bacterium]|nr:HU family DNA-binding protein [Bacteroidales bacterium]
MNNKLLFQDLADQLSESGKLKKKEADEFLKVFFKVIEDALFQGEVVKIQGLGMFRLLKVESRKSVNVSTGEEFEIKEHFKISFTPESALKELVNKPFSYLEPVQLDGPAQADKPLEKAQASVKNKLIEPIVAEEKNQSNKPELTKEEDMPQNRNDHQSPNRNDQREVKPPIPGSRKRSEKKMEKPRSYSGNGFWMFLILVVLALIVWAIVSNQDAKKENELKLKETALFDSTNFEDPAPEDLETIIEDSLKLEAEIALKLESLATADKTRKSTQITSDPASKKLVESKPAQKSAPKEVVKNIANNTGIKFPVFVTLQKGDRLTLLSLKYYGHKVFWVYIYAANTKVILDPDQVPVGTQIRIPTPDPSRIDPNNPDCIAKAKALQTKILSK